MNQSQQDKILLANGTFTFESQETYSKQNVLIGCFVAIAGNILISLSFQVQKLVHKSNTDNRSYLSIPAWWFGLLLMAVGEVGNFLAYGWAPTTLVAPLGAVSVISNCILSRIILKEPVTTRGLIGVLLALIGSSLVAYACPVAATASDIDRSQFLNQSATTSATGLKPSSDIVYTSLVTWRSFGYLVGIALLTVIIANPRGWRWAVSEEQRRDNVMLCVLVCGLLGAFTVMAAKGVSIALGALIAGRVEKFTDGRSWLTYILLFSAVGSIVLQMKYLNQAMIYFGAQEVVPIYYVVFTLVGISAGMVLYSEVEFGNWWRGLLFGVGVCSTFVGVWHISRGADVLPPPPAVEDIPESEVSRSSPYAVISRSEIDLENQLEDIAKVESSSCGNLIHTLPTFDPRSPTMMPIHEHTPVPHVPLSRSASRSNSRRGADGPSIETTLHTQLSHRTLPGSESSPAWSPRGVISPSTGPSGPPGSPATEGSLQNSIWAPNPCGLVEIWQASLEIINHTRTSSFRRPQSAIGGTPSDAPEATTTPFARVAGLLDFFSLSQTGSGKLNVAMTEAQNATNTNGTKSNEGDNVRDGKDADTEIGSAGEPWRPRGLLDFGDDVLQEECHSTTSRSPAETDRSDGESRSPTRGLRRRSVDEESDLSKWALSDESASLVSSPDSSASETMQRAQWRMNNIPTRTSSSSYFSPRGNSGTGS